MQKLMIIIMTVDGDVAKGSMASFLVRFLGFTIRLKRTFFVDFFQFENVLFFPLKKKQQQQTFCFKTQIKMTGTVHYYRCYVVMCCCGNDDVSSSERKCGKLFKLYRYCKILLPRIKTLKIYSKVSSLLSEFFQQTENDNFASAALARLMSFMARHDDC